MGWPKLYHHHPVSTRVTKGSGMQSGNTWSINVEIVKQVKKLNDNKVNNLFKKKKKRVVWT